MALVIPSAFRAKALEHVVNKTAPENLVLKLFKNNYTPVVGSAVGNFTEADFTGYASEPLTAGSWTAAVGSTSTITYNETVSFVSTANAQNQSVYGYYVVGATSGELKWAERFTDGPYVIQNEDDAINVLLRMTATGL